MDPQNNQQPAIEKNRMLWVWIALIGGFVLILLLVDLLFFQPNVLENSTVQENVQNEQQEDLTPAGENIDQEVKNIDLGDLDTDFEEVQKDIDQL